MDVMINELRKVDEPSDSPGYLRVYLSVTATDGIRTITEEFLIGRQVVGRAIVQNAQGWLKTTSGTYIDPTTLDPTTLDPTQPAPQWEYEVVIQDFKAEILAVLKVAFNNMLLGKHREDTDKTLLRKRLEANFGSNLNLPLSVNSMAGKTEII